MALTAGNNKVINRGSRSFRSIPSRSATGGQEVSFQSDLPLEPDELLSVIECRNSGEFAIRGVVFHTFLKRDQNGAYKPNNALDVRVSVCSWEKPTKWVQFRFPPNQQYFLDEFKRMSYEMLRSQRASIAYRKNRKGDMIILHLGFSAIELYKSNTAEGTVHIHP
jgi:hypothetical protein